MARVKARSNTTNKVRNLEQTFVYYCHKNISKKSNYGFLFYRKLQFQRFFPELMQHFIRLNYAFPLIKAEQFCEPLLFPTFISS